VVYSRVSTRDAMSCVQSMLEVFHKKFWYSSLVLRTFRFTFDTKRRVNCKQTSDTFILFVQNVLKLSWRFPGTAIRFPSKLYDIARFPAAFTPFQAKSIEFCCYSIAAFPLKGLPWSQTFLRWSVPFSRKGFLGRSYPNETTYLLLRRYFFRRFLTYTLDLYITTFNCYIFIIISTPFAQWSGVFIRPV